MSPIGLGAMRLTGPGVFGPPADPAEAERQPGGASRRLMRGGDTDALFDDQLAAMIAARDEGLIGAVGLSNVEPRRSWSMP